MKYLIILLTLIIILSCSQHTSDITNLDSCLEINFEGEKIIDPENPQEYVYRQTITWENKNSDVIYAYRIFTTNDELPQDLEIDENGEVLFDDEDDTD